MYDPVYLLSLRRLASDEIGTWRFQSTHPPVPRSALDELAFGGSTLALAIHAAYHTLPEARASQLRIYSVLGHFHGPSRHTIPLQISVKAIRDTRSFATREVTVQQSTSAGSTQLRTTSVILIDFVARASGRTILTFSEQPHDPNISDHSKLPDTDKVLKKEIEDGSISPRSVGYMTTLFDFVNMWRFRYCPEGILGQTSIGARPDKATTQDSWPHAKKRSYDWLQFHARLPLASESTGEPDRLDQLLPPTKSAASASLIAFTLDTWMSAIAIFWGRFDNSQYQVMSTIDFALRFHVDDLDATKWHLRQHTVLSAQDECNYVQAHLWEDSPASNADATSGKKLVATLTQTCVLKGPASKAPGTSKI